MCTMQSVKKPSAPLPPLRGMRRELQYLYARRSTIDALIESLQQYERYSAKNADARKRKLA